MSFPLSAKGLGLPGDDFIEARDTAVQKFLIPVALAGIFLSGTFFRETVESLHTGIYCAGFYSTWIIPSSDLVLLLAPSESGIKIAACVACGAVFCVLLAFLGIYRTHRGLMVILLLSLYFSLLSH
eukprot:m.518489 g.518489  ORF g.518489 m.518489 type:complete len:126 (+) comp57487_c0_seq17:346-723(+)